MTKTNQKFYAWVGQNASCGTPNQITGRMSMYGDNIVFSCKEDRDRFVDEFTSDNPSEYVVKCSLRKLRSYNLGCSVSNFEDNLRYLEYGYFDDEDGEGTHLEKLD